MFVCRDTGPTINHNVPAIPLSVTSRLEEDSVPNYMPCHMQPVLNPPLISRSWMPVSDDRAVSRDDDQPSVASTAADHKVTPSLDDVKKQAPAGPQTDKMDNDTQTGLSILSQ